MPYRPPDEELQRLKKEFYRKHPEYQGGQSTWSKVLDFFGMDNPYANDSSSYDYRKKAWDEYGDPSNPDYGNPDVSWMLPEFPDSWTNAAADAYDAAKDWWNGTYEGDPRSWQERYSGAILNGLDWATFNFGDEAAAAFSSIMNGTPYDKEYANAQRIHEGYREWEPDFSPLDLGSGAAGIFGSAGAAMVPFTGAQKAIKAAQKVIGVPGAKTLPGKFVQSAASGVPAGIVNYSLYTIGDAEGALAERGGAITDQDLINGAIFGSILGGPGRIIWEGTKKGGKKVIDYVKGKPVHPKDAKQLPGANSMRIPLPRKPKVPKPDPKKDPGGAKPKPKPKGPEPTGTIPNPQPGVPLIPPRRPPLPIIGVRDDIEKAIQDSVNRSNRKKR